MLGEGGVCDWCVWIEFSEGGVRLVRVECVISVGGV